MDGKAFDPEKVDRFIDRSGYLYKYVTGQWVRAKDYDKLLELYRNRCGLEPVASIAERVFPEEVKEIQRPAPHIDSDRMIGPTDWDRECQESGRLNKRC